MHAFNDTNPALFGNSIIRMHVVYTYYLKTCSKEPSEEATPASLVLSSQILGYSGGDLDTNETVELTFPIKVYK